MSSEPIQGASASSTRLTEHQVRRDLLVLNFCTFDYRMQPISHLLPLMIEKIDCLENALASLQDIPQGLTGDIRRAINEAKSYLPNLKPYSVES